MMGDISTAVWLCGEEMLRNVKSVVTCFTPLHPVFLLCVVPSGCQKSYIGPGGRSIHWPWWTLHTLAPGGRSIHWPWWTLHTLALVDAPYIGPGGRSV